MMQRYDRETPKGKTLRLIADNYATHKHSAVQDWLAQASAIQHALHANLRAMAEHGREILPRHQD